MDEMFDFAPQRDKLYKQIADRIQDLIVTESLRPGDKLPGERELAERMGVSRTVIREAIRALNVRGLVKVKSGCGTFVQELSAENAAAHISLFLKLKRAPESYEKVYEVRRMIEIEAAGLAAERSTVQDLIAMQREIERMRAFRADREQFVAADLAFHKAVAAATRNELLSVLLTPISDLLREFVVLSTYAASAADDGIAHHKTILTAIRDRNADRARQAMRDHLAHAHQLVVSVQRQMAIEHKKEASAAKSIVDGETMAASPGPE